MSVTRAGPHTVAPWVVLVGILVLAANLRAALAGYPPLLETAREELGISAGTAGLVQAGAILMMALGSFVGSAFDARVGRERGLGVAVGLVAAGSLVRGVPLLAPVIGGSLLIGLGIGLAGVLLTGVVKQHLAERAGSVTGGYTVSMMVGATVSSALAVPLATVLGGWSFSLAVWAVPAALAVAVWAPIAARMAHAGTSTVSVPAVSIRTATVPAGSVPAGSIPAVRKPGPAQAKPVSMALPWRDPVARLIAAYLAGTAMAFYGWLTWLSPYYEGQGWSPGRAGLLLAVWSVAQIPAALLGPVLAQRRRRWRFWAGLALACGLAGTLGAMLMPMPPVVGPWLWAALMGVGAGAGFSLGLTVIAWRTPDPAASAATSGLALGVAYLSAGIGPLLMGLLIDVTGGFAAALTLLLVAGVFQGWAIRGIGDGPAA